MWTRKPPRRMMHSRWLRSCAACGVRRAGKRPVAQKAPALDAEIKRMAGRRGRAAVSGSPRGPRTAPRRSVIIWTRPIPGDDEHHVSWREYAEDMGNDVSAISA